MTDAELAAAERFVHRHSHGPSPGCAGAWLKRALDEVARLQALLAAHGVIEGTAENALMTPPETSAFLQVPEGTLAQWRYRGVGPPFIKVGQRQVRYRCSDLNAWLETQTRGVAGSRRP